MVESVDHSQISSAKNCEAPAPESGRIGSGQEMGAGGAWNPGEEEMAEGTADQRMQPRHDLHTDT